MLRFVPDSWQGVLLRPLLLADPVAGLYTELQAPDWRFLLLALLLLVALIARRGRPLLNGIQWRVLIGLVLSLYLWTAVSGNGRYFFWGLLLVGPMVVLAARRMPGSQSLRNTVIVGAIALQGWSAWMTYEPNVWSLRPWTSGPLLARAQHPLAERPAVFMTVGSISHSLLVPTMHPQSHWTNVSGLQTFQPGMREYARQQALFASALPRYGVIRAARLVMTDDNQPTEQAWAIIRRAFQRYPLAPAAKPCTFMHIDWGGPPFELTPPQKMERGFWFCELEAAAPAAEGAERERHAPELDDVFAQVEKRCPRFFPPNDAQTKPVDEGAARLYTHSDTGLTITHEGTVHFKNMRALNATQLGRVDDVRAGRFRLECDRLPGRYLAPWARGWGADLE